jgi:FdrA protein
VRALFTGGTFCYEAQLAFIARGLACRSNAPAHGAASFAGRFEGHVMLDLGDDDYTRGRPHPMIDPSLRDDAVRAQGEDPNTAVILFDVVLGYGAHNDPAQGLARALSAAAAAARAQGRSLALIGHVCGTDADPQDKAAQVAQLHAAGAWVAGSNVEAALLAARLASRLAR